LKNDFGIVAIANPKFTRLLALIRAGTCREGASCLRILLGILAVNVTSGHVVGF
jgi:hypothetical protein